ncbi:hypothetical protein ASD00_27255 [Ensifer sp. Root31]|nr:hypothetical protein ASD00_27255 [Ensifer sp. Root31]
MLELDEDSRSWLVNAIPDRVATSFAAAAEVVFIADFHRPVSHLDADLYKTFPNPWLTFVGEDDIIGGWARLRSTGIVASHSAEQAWQYGHARGLEPGQSPEKRCRYLLFGPFGAKAWPPKRLAVVLSFEGIEHHLVRAVKEVAGIVFLVEDGNGAPKIDPDNFDMRFPSDKLVDIVNALMALRKAYGTTARGN